jgi:hypothetical protein
MIFKVITITAALVLLSGTALAQTVSDLQLSKFCAEKAEGSSTPVELALPNGATATGNVTCSSGGGSFELVDISTDDEAPTEREIHNNNGGGNGVQDAPGNSGNTRGDDADGANTEGTEDTRDSDRGNNGSGQDNGGGKKD